MPRFARMLTAFDSTPPEPVSFQSDLIVTLASLLCALICLVGLFAVARCALLRRRRSSSSSSVSSPDPSQASANKGLKKKILNSLPKFTYGAAVATGGGVCCVFELTECAICLGEFSEGDEVRVLPQCGHGFHVGCIDKWLESHSSCPSCRQILAVVATCQKCGKFLDPAVSSSSRGCETVVVEDCQPCKDNNHNNNRSHLVNVGLCLDKSHK